METEIAAVVTVARKLETLCVLLDKRIMRAALDTVSPTVKAAEKVFKLGEYKRLAVNLSVMEHRIRCALGDGATDMIGYAAEGRYGFDLWSRRVKKALADAERVLRTLGVGGAELTGYKRLPLYKSECAKIKRAAAARIECGGTVSVSAESGAAYAYCRGDRTAQAL